MPAVPTGVYRINDSVWCNRARGCPDRIFHRPDEVTKAFWDDVYAWAVNNGYSFTNAGIAEGPEHPVHSVNWYDCVNGPMHSPNGMAIPPATTPIIIAQVYRTGRSILPIIMSAECGRIPPTHRIGVGSGRPWWTGREQVCLG